MSQNDEGTVDRTQIYALDDGARGGGLWQRMLRRLLERLQSGSLRVVLPGGREVCVTGREPGIDACVHLHRWRAVRRLLTGGDLGFAEAYLDGDWTSPDVTNVVRLGARNASAFEKALNGPIISRVLNRVGHLLNANTRAGSQRNIEAHYDLGNDFYRLWLDPTMLYSSALWRDGVVTLEQAQRLKLDRICELLDMRDGQRVLEIGFGWGALAAQLAVQHRAHVTGLTLSPSQLAWARDVVASRGAAQSVDLRQQDYRDVTGQFDKVVSIEMFEAVGEKYWGPYFSTIKRSLKPDGLCVLQVISIAEDRYEGYRRGTDFIQKHVFPGGFLPSKTALRSQIEAAGLELRDAEFFGQSYALTLAEWRRVFDARWPEIKSQGFDERFRRLWDYYLCYCEAGFREGFVDVGLYTISHAQSR